MSGAGSGYELTSFTFSPDGKLFQVEYAAKAVDKEAISIGVHCSDGILLAVEKPLTSALLTPGSNPRIHLVDYHIACATCGYRPDCYAAVVKAREEARSYLDSFGDEIPVAELVARLAFHFHSAHGFAAIRPYGCGLILGSATELYAIEPNGQYFGYFAVCFGKESTLARNELQRTEWAKISVDQAVPIIAKIIAGLPQSQGTAWEIEMTKICAASGGKPERIPAAVIAGNPH
jgi:20S proteasome subunit alpha 7